MFWYVLFPIYPKVLSGKAYTWREVGLRQSVRFLLDTGDWGFQSRRWDEVLYAVGVR
jgi:hypothetical protein